MTGFLNIAAVLILPLPLMLGPMTVFVRSNEQREAEETRNQLEQNAGQE